MSASDKPTGKRAAATSPQPAPPAAPPSAPHTDFSASMSYGDYLRLDQLLAQQVPVSGSH
ncbi:MAG: tryptophan 2,3-dioxygenase, partial [Proteobacteria bacterium]|nr:tryptophan 2,3-dioxygenase [Pseudomonadota bacterium]